jgi:hypothetical protein
VRRFEISVLIIGSSSWPYIYIYSVLVPPISTVDMQDFFIAYHVRTEYVLVRVYLNEENFMFNPSVTLSVVNTTIFLFTATRVGR